MFSNGLTSIFHCYAVLCGISEKKSEEDTERWFVKRARTEDNKGGQASCSESLSRCTDTLHPAESSSGTNLGDADDDDGDDDGSTSYVVKRISAFLSETEPYILDIDLDFFTCKNPFKELYTQVCPTDTPPPQ